MLIIGFDSRVNVDEGQVDIGPHVMHLQTPIAIMKFEEIGYFRLPQGQPFSWESGHYASFSILHDTVFMMGSKASLHQQDIWVIRICGFEFYYNNGKQVKFADTARIRAATSYSYQGIYTPYDMDHIFQLYAMAHGS